MADKTPTKTKKLQLQVDRDTANEAESIFKEIGINPTTAVNAFYKRVVATGGIPFPLQLTHREMLNRQFLEATKDIPVKSLDTPQKIQEWLNDTDDE